MKKSNATYSNVLKVALEATGTLSEEFPRIKPLMKVFVFFGTLLFLIVAIPILGISRLLLPSKPNAFRNLQMELETKWYSESSFAALNALRDVYKVLKEKSYDLHKGIPIDPYGKFKFLEYLSAVELLYHYEMRHKNWNKAIEVCDTLIEPLIGRKNKMKGALDKWIVYRAKALYRLKGNASTQGYLLKHIDTKRDTSSVNRYLHELRDSSKQSQKKYYW